MGFNFLNELKIMGNNYKAEPMRIKKLPKPGWMNSKDPLSAIYKEKDRLLSRGGVYYGYIVQANTLLFKPFVLGDCPACILYSDAPEVNANPYILEEIAEELYSYKFVDDSEVPEEMKSIVASIQDEYMRDSFKTTIELEDGKEAVIYYKIITVFRKYLPRHFLKGSLMPILAQPEELSSAMILPKQYWSEEFKKNFW